MLYREIIAVCSEIHTKHIHTLCGQNVEFLILYLVARKVTNGEFDIQRTVHRDIRYILIIKPTRRTNFSNLFFE
jgi:hypothetical protein